MAPPPDDDLPVHPMPRVPAALLAVAVCALTAALAWRFVLAGTSMLAELLGLPLGVMRTPGLLPAVTVAVGALVGVNAYLLLRRRARRAFVRAEVVAYLAAAAYLVLFKSRGERALSLDLAAFRDHMSGELVFNVALLVPFGALAYRWWGRLRVALLVGAGVAVGVEALQYVFALGVSDVVDVVTNVAGVLVGWGIVAAAARRGWSVAEQGPDYVVVRRRGSTP